MKNNGKTGGGAGPRAALVTGASEGIGRAFAKRLAADGWTVTAVARNAARLDGLVAELPGQGHGTLVADLTDPRDVERVGARLRDGAFRLLVNNAGFGAYGKFHETSLETLQRMMRVNCDALTALAHAFLADARSGDALVNVASTASFHPFPRNGIYGATKAFVRSLSESLWYEQKGRGVFVLALCPGYTLTEFSRRAGKADQASFRKFAQTPEQVVDKAMSALRSRSCPVVVSGLQNLAMTQLQRVLPHKAAITLVGRAFEKFLAGPDDGKNKA